MVLFNYSTKELTAKIVYYGPGLCGKTTNLQFIFDNLPSNIHKGKMLSLATKTDRTLFFDFLPIDLGTIRGMRTRLQLYTVPGQVFYNTTRKLVLKGADGLVFVGDSQKKMLDANRESFRNMEQNLIEHGMELPKVPHVLQFNKRDLKDVLSVEELNAALNKHNVPIYEAVATTGIGVQDTLKAVTRLVLNSLREKYSDGKRSSKPLSASKAPEAPAPAVAQAEPVLELADAEEEPVLAIADETVEGSDVTVIEVEVPVLQMVEEAVSGKSESIPIPLDDAGEATEETIELVEEVDALEEEPPPSPALVVDESPFGELETESELPGAPEFGALETGSALDESPLGGIEEDEESGSVDIELPESEEEIEGEAGPGQVAYSRPGAPAMAVPDGATVAIEIASETGSGPTPAAAREATFPVSVEVQGKVVNLMVSVSVRIDRS